MPPTDRQRLGRLHAGGHAIAYHEAGAGAASALLVHGNFASKRWFAPLLAAPPAGTRLVALDLPGFGDSGPLAGAVSIDAYASALRAAADALGLERPALVGHSLGGNVAMAAAAADPGAWSALALVSSGAPSGHVTPEGVYAVLEAYRTDRALLARSLAAVMPTTTPANFEEIVDDALRMQPSGFTGNARALEALAQRPELDPTPRLAAFTGPVLVLRGALDTLITAEMAAATAAAFPASTFVRCETWDDVGHSPPLEQPARFRDRLTELLAVAAPPTAPPPTAPREAP